MNKVNHKTISFRQCSNDKIVRILAIESSCDETAASVVEVVSNNRFASNKVIKKSNRVISNKVIEQNTLILNTSNERSEERLLLNTRIISNIVSSQVKLHAAYGGVYPELASREHIRNILPVISESLQNIAQLPMTNNQLPNNFQFSNNQLLNKSSIENLKSKIDCLAVTTGPGLIGSLLVGVNTAKTLAYVLNKPIYAINHLEGHIYSNFVGEFPIINYQFPNKYQIQNPKKLKSYKLQAMPKFPILALVVSGGHTSLVYMKNHFDYQVIGETLDDAAGEAFDKVAKMLGLGYPGGPVIAKMAMETPIIKSQIPNKSQISNSKFQNPKKLKSHPPRLGEAGEANKLFTFPRPMIKEDNFDFSFSGLKTSVLYTWQKLKIQSEKLKTKSEILNLKSKICYEFQEAVVDTLVTKTLRAAEKYKVKSILLCGGVSANSRLREVFTGTLNHKPYNYNFFVPDKKLTGDNAAMIGIAAAYRAALGKKPTPWYDVNADANQKLF